MKYPSISSDLVFSNSNLNFYSHSNLSNKFIKDNIKETLFDNSSEFLHSFFNMENVNFTENRSALHFAPRYFQNANFSSNFPSIFYDLNQMFDISDRLNSSDYSHIKDIIHLGTGGSYLGPKMIYECFSHMSKGPNVHFVSNIDPLSLNKIILKLNPENTLIISVSKSFTTYETQLNLKRLKSWFISNDLLDKFFVNLFIITSFPNKAKSYGALETNILNLDINIGGRYSIWSSSNLITSILFGREFFMLFLKGGNSIDHQVNKDFKNSLPFLLALKSYAYRLFYGVTSHFVVAYSDRLEYLPSYLQQLIMESNGKSYNKHGEHIDLSPCSTIFGSIGTDAQHSFFQAMHQSLLKYTGDLLIFDEHIDSNYILDEKLDIQASIDLNKNAIAQYLAFKKGNINSFNQNPHKYIPGNKPVDLFSFNKLNAYTLGQILSIYEYKTLIEGSYLKINPFDQYGVELGKKIFKKM